MPEILTTRAHQIRLEVERLASSGLIADALNPLIEEALTRFNDHAELNVVTSVLARALFARAMLNVAGEWLADVSGQIRPDCIAAVWDIARNPPAEFDEDHWCEMDRG